MPPKPLRKHWLHSLEDSRQVKVKEAIEKLRLRQLYHYEQYEKLSPPPGTIAIGSEHYRAWLTHLCYKHFIRAIEEQGYTPTEAEIEAHFSVVPSINEWNNKREWQVHISIDMPHGVLLTPLIMIAQVAKE